MKCGSLNYFFIKARVQIVHCTRSRFLRLRKITDREYREITEPTPRRIIKYVLRRPTRMNINLFVVLSLLMLTISSHIRALSLKISDWRSQLRR